ncbi:Flp family type IVb pilin [Blastochloris tepida]|uniref:Flp family type IVb pilin n=1 Tax=Blastochloris tepida TaxID=2233851 RepID=A0A348G5K7_9HYPH|nr:Flp family type IVb pilin [Blastochloris tepida]BBF94840.1 hypothetical protein BLTE_35250 [Blastochloris tepida]
MKSLIVRLWRDERAVVAAEYGWVAAGLSVATLVAALAIAERLERAAPLW